MKNNWLILLIMMSMFSSKALPQVAVLKKTRPTKVAKNARQPAHVYNGSYPGGNTDKIAFPIGGIGAGMFCIEGSGAISHLSIRNKPDIYNEPPVFAAIGAKGHPEQARVLEGPVPNWKKFGPERSGDGSPGTTWGLPRFKAATFTARFPFAQIDLKDPALPLKASITAWSPFIPTDENSSSLPLGAIEYSFTNTGKTQQEYVFSFNAANFLSKQVKAVTNGFMLSDEGTVGHPEQKVAIAFTTDDNATVVDPAWFRGGFYDALTMAWHHIEKAETVTHPALRETSPGSSLYVPFKLPPGTSKTIRLLISWYAPDTKMRYGWSLPPRDAILKSDSSVADHSAALPSPYYKPWYSSQFKNIDEVITYWQKQYDTLKHKTQLFTHAFYNSTLPSEVTEAVAANLCILKSPTILRQYDGRFWGWEGSHDDRGSCPGSCTHVYNYAQSICHLFPVLERSMRETEFNEDQDTYGKQSFRALIPIRPVSHEMYAAADGQLGGIMKVYRDWRISGDNQWLKTLYPKVKLSLDYCIRQWDPRHTGTIEEPHHNTYDIEFWGANSFTTGFYLGALEAMMQIGSYLHDDVNLYQSLYERGKQAIVTKLWNGEYFNQKIQWKGFDAANPVEMANSSLAGPYSPEGIEMFKKEGPRYQYGNGCLSEGVIGAWMTRVCGLPDPFDSKKINSHLLAVYKYNFKKDLSEHANPQRPGFALGNEGGLLLCTWPKGGQPTLPFVYSNEVWTGIEYEVASHLIFTGHVQEGLNIVKTIRARYDGSIRNPFDEYECGHWYARAMSSYALIEALTGVRYDAVTKTLYVNSKIGDFTSFLSTNTGFGNVFYKNGNASLIVVYGQIEVKSIITGHEN